jgi:hypothetical protein
MMSKAIWAGAAHRLIATITAGGVSMAALLLAAALPAGAQTPDKARHMIDGVRDARYCEIIPVVRRGVHLLATVYNTLGQNDCPPETWDKITEPAMKKRFGAITVVLNGPRHFVMDAIAAAGDTAAGKTIDVEGLALTARATINVGLAGLRAKPYRERTIDRETRYVFRANQPVFLLVRPDGVRYAMQSYAQMIDKSLTYDDLPGLASRLKLPAGWRYEVMKPDSDLLLGATGKAIVVQDDLDNTYQKLD